MAKRRIGHNSGTLWMIRRYNVLDHDPECDRVFGFFQKEHIKESDLAVVAGLASTTVKNMFGGKTRRPQHATFVKMYGAIGYKYDLVRVEKPDYEKEIPQAREEFKNYRAMLAKKKKTNGHAKTPSKRRK